MPPAKPAAVEPVEGVSLTEQTHTLVLATLTASSTDEPNLSFTVTFFLSVLLYFFTPNSSLFLLLCVSHTFNCSRSLLLSSDALWLTLAWVQSHIDL